MQEKARKDFCKKRPGIALASQRNPKAEGDGLFLEKDRNFVTKFKNQLDFEFTRKILNIYNIFKFLLTIYNIFIIGQIFGLPTILHYRAEVAKGPRALAGRLNTDVPDQADDETLDEYYVLWILN
mgnify:CR=1 FL=1